jgi:NAD(P)H-hydrate repair Nnr-like enzyme with NAD(P)H-hydrate epimerase domain
MKIITAKRMKELEIIADANGYSFESMMKAAGSHLAHFLMDRYQDLEVKRVIGLIGGGNNGGDTLLAMADLQRAGWSCLGLLVSNPAQPEWILAITRDAGCELVPIGHR